MPEIIDKQIKETKKKIADLKEILQNPDNQELFVLAEQEIKELEEKEKQLSKQLENEKSHEPIP